MEDRPFYVVFAGVNGAGKSTLFHTGLWKTSAMPASMPRVNPDELLRAAKGNWANRADQIAAGKAALQAIDGHFAARRSFNHETTLTGHRALANIARARDRGYRVHLYYVGVADEQVALERIAHRVDTGGHDIDARTVRRRYTASLSNFAKALDLCDEAQALDNTQALTTIALWRKGVLAWWGVSGSRGAWLPQAMADEEVWRRA